MRLESLDKGLEMKKILLAIVIIFVVGCANNKVEPTPSINPKEHSCLDEQYLELKNKDIEEMTDREFKYFITKDEECLSYTMAQRQINELKELDIIGISIWTMASIMIFEYFGIVDIF